MRLQGALGEDADAMFASSRGVGGPTTLARFDPGQDFPLAERPREARPTRSSNGVSYQLGLHFLGFAGLPESGWLERPPEYELIIQAGEAAKRLRPRVPAPPLDGASSSGGLSEDDLRALVPGSSNLLRVDERTAMRLSEPAAFVYVDVWEERMGLLDLGRKVPSRNHLGQCYVPLEPRFNKRPCTWSIVRKEGAESKEVGYITCRFALGTSPTPVRNLRVVSGTTRASELRLVWDPPANDGGLPLRGYRIEAREPQHGGRVSASGMPGYFADEPRTASAQPSKDPSATLKNLTGNTAYTIRVWAVNEAGPGPAAEVMGQTGAVPPGVCGPARAATDSGDQVLLSVEWDPPIESGGADVVAYRVWLRPVFQDGLGNFFPADGFIDLGLFEHRGSPAATQQAPVRLDQMPSCSGCLCSVAAINSAGLTGPSTTEAPVVWAGNVEREKEIFELNTASPVPTDMTSAPAVSSSAGAAGACSAAPRSFAAEPVTANPAGHMAGSFSAPVAASQAPAPSERGLSTASRRSSVAESGPTRSSLCQPQHSESNSKLGLGPQHEAQMVENRITGAWADAATPCRAGAGPAAAGYRSSLPEPGRVRMDATPSSAAAAAANPPVTKARGETSSSAAAAVAAKAAAAIGALDEERGQRQRRPAWDVSSRGALIAASTRSPARS
eukprot:TRINITY_DN33071_c0_g1_i1.p1 TRINITY_DN33071_c0_g1~~TRINITY_DN33071_c0_g1_i1.p1  ORF type:complete len:695 (+),score=137.55 TRINITY_DN33071_c0_g1_i1:72-2087(+)